MLQPTSRPLPLSQIYSRAVAFLMNSVDPFADMDPADRRRVGGLVRSLRTEGAVAREAALNEAFQEKAGFVKAFFDHLGAELALKEEQAPDVPGSTGPK